MTKIEQIVSLITQLEELDFDDTDRVEYMRPIFEALYPLGISRIEFRTYQPSFNDGDLCTPRVIGSLYISVDREARAKIVQVLKEYDVERGYEYADDEYDTDFDEYEMEASPYHLPLNVKILSRLGMSAEDATTLLTDRVSPTLKLLDKLVNYDQLEINIKYSYAYNEAMNLRESGEEYYCN